jgi:hypothetical protein
VNDLWEKIEEIMDIVIEQSEKEFPKEYLFENLEKELSIIDSKIRSKKSSAGFFAKVFSSSYSSELVSLNNNREKINKQISDLQKEKSDFRYSNEKKVLPMRMEADSLYQRIKPVFDYWPTYPPDWDKRSAKKRSSLKSRVCPKCGSSQRKLDVHHKVPISQGGNHKNNNLEVICHSCHKSKHGVTKFSKISKPSARQRTISNIASIEKAIQRNKTIKFRYRKFNGEIGMRTIDPEKIIMVKNSKCVRGFCHLRKAERTFAIKRISRLKTIR